MNIACPNCNAKRIGRISPRIYFCRECCIELEVTPKKVNVFQVEKDGTLTSLNDLFSKENI
jgi:ribosomal protein L37AE/L43A